jgi:hypothetical protein
MPEALKLLDVPKEREYLSSSGASSGAITAQDHSDDTSEETSN